MDLPAIKEAWSKDSVIDQVMLDEASLRIPQLHQKYLGWRQEFSLLAKRKRQELKKLQHAKTLYYSGKAHPEEYEKEPFNYKLMKSDVPAWVAVDESVNKVEMQLEYYNEILDSLDEILKQINQMSFNIKNAVQWRMFVGGGTGL